MTLSLNCWEVFQVQIDTAGTEFRQLLLLFLHLGGWHLLRSRTIHRFINHFHFMLTQYYIATLARCKKPFLGLVLLALLCFIHVPMPLFMFSILSHISSAAIWDFIRSKVQCRTLSKHLALTVPEWLPSSIKVTFHSLLICSEYKDKHSFYNSYMVELFIPFHSFTVYLSYPSLFHCHLKINPMKESRKTSTRK